MPQLNASDIELPDPDEPLPELSHGELYYVHRSARLVKGGNLYAVTFQLHKGEECLECSWSEQGHGTICK